MANRIDITNMNGIELAGIMGECPAEALVDAFGDAGVGARVEWRMDVPGRFMARVEVVSIDGVALKRSVTVAIDGRFVGVPANVVRENGHGRANMRGVVAFYETLLRIERVVAEFMCASTDRLDFIETRGEHRNGVFFVSRDDARAMPD